MKKESNFNIEKFSDGILSSMEVEGCNEITPTLLEKQEILYSESTVIIDKNTKPLENVWLVLYKLKNNILILLTRDYLQPSTTYKIKIYYKPSQYHEVLFFLKNVKK